MTDQAKHKLDVDFEVREHPRDKFFPRLPNVVSHRGHQLRIKATIHGVQKNTQRVTLQADVLVYGSETLSEHGHASSSVQLWGHAPEQSFPVNAETPFPHSIHILVTKSLKDDHLGEGPFGAFITVTEDNIPFVNETPAVGSAGTAEGGAAGGTGTAATAGNANGDGSVTITSGQTFELDFVSK